MRLRKLIALTLFVLMFCSLLSGCRLSLPWMEEDDNDIDPVADVGAGTEDPVQPPEPPSVPTSQRMKATVLYLADADMNGLVSFQTEIPWVVGIAKSTVNHLVDNLSNYYVIAGTDLKLPLPEGTEILGATIKEDGLCKMDFSKELLDCSSAQHEKIAVDAIVYTLTEFTNVDRVQIMVEGKMLEELPYGTQIDQPLSRAATSEKTSEIELYFVSDAGTKVEFVPVACSSVKDLGQAFVELIQGPCQDSGLISVIPSSTKILGIRTNNDTVTINFSREILDYGGGSSSEYALLGSIVLTATSCLGIEKVILEVEGERIEWPNGTDGSFAFIRQDFINEEGEC